MNFDPTEQIRSESVLLACTSEDGRDGIFGRLCRYPSAGVAWVWMHAFIDRRVVGYVGDDVACGSDVLDTNADDAEYAPLDPSLIRLSRQGTRSEPSSATLRARVPAHEATDIPAGPGPVTLEVEATFTPEFAGGGTLHGRSELLGQVHATVLVDGRSLEVAGRGQWHEQHQTAPRFLQPFVYASLRGASLGIVGLGGPWGSYGFVRRRGIDEVKQCAVTFEGTSRAVFDVDGEPQLEVAVQVVTAYTVPIYEKRWHGHQVIATTGAERLSGFWNVWGA